MDFSTGSFDICADVATFDIGAVVNYGLNISFNISFETFQ